MAVWHIRRLGDSVTLTYSESARPGHLEKMWGEVPLALEADLESLAGHEAAVWDAIVTPHGVFVRQEELEPSAGRI